MPSSDISVKGEEGLFDDKLRRTTSDQKARKLEIKENTRQTGIPLLEGEEIETNNKSSPEDLFSTSVQGVMDLDSRTEEAN